MKEIYRFSLFCKKKKQQRKKVVVVHTQNGSINPYSLDKYVNWGWIPFYGGKCYGKKMVLDWDCSLHLPPWVSKNDKASIKDSGVDIRSLASALEKPLLPDVDSGEFIPVILVSASCSIGAIQKRTTTSEFSWNYILGSGDNKESWARGLTKVFSRNMCSLSCSQSHRGQNASQITTNPKNLSPNNAHITIEDQCMDHDADARSSAESDTIFWLGSTNVAVGTSQNVRTKELGSHGLLDASMYLRLPIVKLLVCCPDDKQTMYLHLYISVCVCPKHILRNGICGKKASAYLQICKNARPSRGNLRQVFNFVNKDASNPGSRISS
ncbi:hypothetical protein MKW98_006469 [Papaver atlanticum]|uniref:Rit1 N-terminal domain-containing protein n=1 Tax=Papaver atlanticum TaxID=357466 RepID=A0AAD4SGR6_9MAGN|nr:hypothetical protein MKW98_006469 [Papaver atlanticum]